MLGISAAGQLARLFKTISNESTCQGSAKMPCQVIKVRFAVMVVAVALLPKSKICNHTLNMRGCLLWSTCNAPQRQIAGSLDKSMQLLPACQQRQQRQINLLQNEAQRPLDSAGPADSSLPSSSSDFSNLTSDYNEVTALTPRELVKHLDRNIVGQVSASLLLKSRHVLWCSPNMHVLAVLASLQTKLINGNQVKP